MLSHALETPVPLQLSRVRRDTGIADGPKRPMPGPWAWGQLGKVYFNFRVCGSLLQRGSDLGTPPGSSPSMGLAAVRHEAYVSSTGSGLRGLGRSDRSPPPIKISRRNAPLAANTRGASYFSFRGGRPFRNCGCGSMETPLKRWRRSRRRGSTEPSRLRQSVMRRGAPGFSG